MTILLDGKKLSSICEADLKQRVAIIKRDKGFVPILATILVGNDPASETYVNMKGNACKRIGMQS
ncbi:MAG TPA: tetrahydrofolate dehydrogenase/cyclohydrolase catalytic domain-containing protein, partial [SAR86 cluster bacterium]|nr:tetrahydrofolate dehydrogenase/cyclohydrolase catalytic domain-containing protein [SAR86 cluster bacterium]